MKVPRTGWLAASVSKLLHFILLEFQPRWRDGEERLEKNDPSMVGLCVAEFVGLPFQSFTVPIQAPSDKSFVIHGNSQELQPLPDQTRTHHWNNKLSQPVSICSCLREVQTSFQGNPPLIPMEDYTPNQGGTAEHASETNSQLKDVTWKLKNIN